MRVASVMRPAARGTFRSARMKTRFAASSSSSINRTRRPLLAEAPAHQERDVAHPAREAPLVVVPGEDLAERVVQDPREPGVEDRGVGRAVEVRGDERLLAVEEDALERPRGGLLHGRVHLLLARGLLALAR